MDYRRQFEKITRAAGIDPSIFVICWGVAADAAPLADEGTVTVGVTVLTDTLSKLPAELLECVFRVTEDCLSVDVDVALPEVSPAVFAGAAAVPVSLPAITGVVSSAVFAGGSLLMRLLWPM